MITARRFFTPAILGALLLTNGCGHLWAVNTTPAALMEGQLAATLQQVEREILASRFTIADRMLSDFADQHPGTPESIETGFWRALFKLDPVNTSVGPREAIALLDSYLATPVVTSHRGAAIALRRAALALERPTVAVSSQPAPTASGSGIKQEAKGETKPDEKPAADEIQRLKEELAKANAELERIKRRLAQPNP
jgi:hypothetical protein